MTLVLSVVITLVGQTSASLEDRQTGLWLSPCWQLSVYCVCRFAHSWTWTRSKGWTWSNWDSLATLCVMHSATTLHMSGNACRGALLSHSQWRAEMCFEGGLKVTTCGFKVVTYGFKVAVLQYELLVSFIVHNWNELGSSYIYCLTNSVYTMSVIKTMQL